MGGEWALGVALVMEIWPENKRPLMAGLIGAAANIGYALIALIAIQFPITQKSWRWVMLVGAAPSLLVFFISFFVPESKKWQASIKKGPSRPVREIFGPVLRNRTLLAICFASIPLIVTWGIVQWIPLWADQMTAGTQPKVKAYIQLVSSMGAITGCLIAALVGGALGRRPTYCGLCAFALLASSILFNRFHQYNGAFLVMVGLVGFGSAAFYGWLPLYLPELFPTRVRATGQGLAYNFGRILAALGAWQMGPIMAFFDKSYAKAGSAIVLIYVIGMSIIWLAPETKGKPLPE
jgi:MFS transporter, SHS family, sialic acid transporter